MSAVPDEVGICNLAISLVGGTPIVSLRPPDETKEGRNCLRWFDLLRDGLQRSFPFNCTTTRVQFTAANATAPAYQWTYQYPIQDKYLRVLDLQDISADDWRVESYQGVRHLMTNWSNPKARVIERNTVPAQWDDLLVNAMAHRLAAALAWPLTKNAAMADGLLKASVAMLETAMEIDSQESSQEFVDADELHAVRRGYEAPLYGRNVD